MSTTLNDIYTAAHRLSGVTYRTPLIHSELFSHYCQYQLYFKLENLQKTGSCKLRGAYNKVSSLTKKELQQGLITASSGNHGQGVAYAARRFGVGDKTTIFMPLSSQQGKIHNTESYSVNVKLLDETLHGANEHARHEALRSGAAYIEPFNDWDVIAGQGTIGLEILEDLPQTEVIIVPVGSGGLLAGVALAAKSIKPDICIFGVQAVSSTPTGTTITDGIEVRKIEGKPIELIRRWADGIVVVDESIVEQTMGQLFDGAKVVVEGAGAAGLAALCSNALDLPAATKVVVVLSGGNVDSGVVSRVIRSRMLRTGRLARFRAILPRYGGDLKQLLDLTEEMNGKLVQVNQDQDNSIAAPKERSIELAVEARSKFHRDEILRRLEVAGYQIELL